MHYYFPGIVIGFILLMSAIVAPALFKTLGRESFGKVVRVIWPKFFLGLTAAGLACLTTLLLQEEAHKAHYAIAGGTTGFGLICYLIIPATNRATDSGDDARFKLLHKTSVFLTLAMLAGNIAFVCI